MHTSIEAKCYYDASGVGGSTYTALDIVENVTRGNSRTELPVKLRGQDNTLYGIGMKDGGVDMTLLYEPTDTGYAAMKAAYDGRTVIGLAFLDEDISTATDGDGWEGDYFVSSFEQPQEIDSVFMVNCRVVPALATDAVAPRPYDTGV